MKSVVDDFGIFFKEWGQQLNYYIFRTNVDDPFSQRRQRFSKKGMFIIQKSKINRLNFNNTYTPKSEYTAYSKSDLSLKDILLFKNKEFSIIEKIEIEAGLQPIFRYEIKEIKEGIQ